MLELEINSSRKRWNEHTSTRPLFCRYWICLWRFQVSRNLFLTLEMFFRLNRTLNTTDNPVETCESHGINFKETVPPSRIRIVFKIGVDIYVLLLHFVWAVIEIQYLLQEQRFANCVAWGQSIDVVWLYIQCMLARSLFERPFQHFGTPRLPRLLFGGSANNARAQIGCMDELYRVIVGAETSSCHRLEGRWRVAHVTRSLEEISKILVWKCSMPCKMEGLWQIRIHAPQFKFQAPYL